MRPRVAVVGATGAVGSIVCRLLQERQFPLRSIRFFGSSDKSGRSIEFDGSRIPVEPLKKDRVCDIDLAIASTPDDVARQCAPWFIEQGAVFIDESAAHRRDANVPLVVPEVNADAIADHRGIVASPNCSTTQLVMCLKPIHDHVGIWRVVVSTYQAASGAGRAARDELVESTRAMLDGRETACQEFETPLPMNLIPKIGNIDDEGHSSEEIKMVEETQKILGFELSICVTCVRVPVENCHCESVVVETRQPFSDEDPANWFAAFPGVKVWNDALPAPKNCDGLDTVNVGRIRRDRSIKSGLAFWCVSDNLRKGAATNAVQIAELLVERRLLACLAK